MNFVHYIIHNKNVWKDWSIYPVQSSYPRYNQYEINSLGSLCLFIVLNYDTDICIIFLQMFCFRLECPFVSFLFFISGRCKSSSNYFASRILECFPSLSISLLTLFHYYLCGIHSHSNIKVVSTTVWIIFKKKHHVMFIKLILVI